MTHPDLAVRAVVTGLDSPTAMAFIRRNDRLVLEKNTGKVQSVVNGGIHSTVLDLAVNNASERGLLGSALHPRFPRDPGVYLYWTESTTGADSNVLSETPLLGNRVDRFEWNGSALVQDVNLIHLRAIQQDATNPVARGSHNGGVLAFQLPNDDRGWRDRNAREDEDGNWRWWGDGSVNGNSSGNGGSREGDRGRAKLLIFTGDDGLQQVRWAPTLIANTPSEALSRMNVLAESRYTDPEFSGKFEVAPAGIGFVESRALGREFAVDLFVGASRPTLENGYLLRFNVSEDRHAFDLTADPRLADRVADNVAKFDMTEKRVAPDRPQLRCRHRHRNRPEWNVYVVSLSNGAIYEIYRRRR